MTEKTHTDLDKYLDASKIDIFAKTTNLGELISRIGNYEINFLPDLRRPSKPWSSQEQSRLIESALIHFPIPAFYFDCYENDKYRVFDGVQRLSAINNFVVKKTLALKNLEFLEHYEGKMFDDLSASAKRRIKEFRVLVYLINPGTPIPIKYSLFNRIRRNLN